jgi:hypothetical protein
MARAERDLFSGRKNFFSVPRFFDWCAHWSNEATAAQPYDAYGERPFVYRLTHYHNENHDCRAYLARSDDTAS